MNSISLFKDKLMTLQNVFARASVIAQLESDPLLGSYLSDLATVLEQVVL